MFQKISEDIGVKIKVEINRMFSKISKDYGNNEASKINTNNTIHSLVLYLYCKIKMQLLVEC